MSSSTIELTNDCLARFEMFPNFRRPVNNGDIRIMSIKFSSDGEKLVVASNQRTLELYNCNTGLQENYFHLFKHGMSVIDYMDSSDKILVGSIGVTKGDYAVRALNMSSNKFLTNYIGHNRPSVSLAVNTEKNLFVSGGFDKTALLFDFRIPKAQLCLSDLASVPLVALHPTTDNLCAVAQEDNRIELHDLRFLNYAPFTVFKLNPDQCKWISMKFSSDGDQILISTNSSKIQLINSFHGTNQMLISSRQNTLNIPIDASFSPQSQYILSGSSNGNVQIYNNEKTHYRRDAGEPKYAQLKSMQPEAITAAELNPKYALMATASSYVAFWAPCAD